MSPEDGNFKVAFLVDARRRITPTEKPLEVDVFSRGVRLCVLKLLSYFAHVGGDNRQAIGHLRWGFKVFHSYDYPPCKRDYLKQLSLKNFQDYEDQLAGDLEALSSSIRGKRAPKTPQVLTAISLRQALDDVVHDFQWDGPDVCSPVKRSTAPSPRKRTRSTHVQSSDRAFLALQDSKLLSKCVFLLMPCPASRSELEEFCDFGPDDPLPSTSEFLDMVLPSSSSHQTFQDQNIALYWIDTSPWIATEKRDKDGLSVVSSAMRELGGCVIPVHALVNQTQHITSSLQSILSAPDRSLSSPIEMPTSEPTHREKDTSSLAPSTTTMLHPKSCPNKLKETSRALKEKCENEDKRRSCAFLPFSSVINHYLNTEQKVTPSKGSDAQLQLCSVRGGRVTDFCHLEVFPLTKSIPAEASPPKKTRTIPLKASSTHLAITTPDWSQTFNVTNPNLSDPSHVEIVGSPPSRTRHKSASESRATIRAQLPVGAVPISQYQANAVYTCTGLVLDLAGNSDVVGEVGGHRNEVKLSSWFKETMVSLSRQRKVLLVNMPHPETSIPVAAVLEPLTPTTASLRILKSWPIPGQNYTSCHNVGVSNEDEEGIKRKGTRRRSGAEDVATKMTRIAQEAAKRHHSTKNLLRSPKGAHHTSSPCDMVSFRPHLLEPWFAYCPSGGVSTRLIDQIQSVPHYDKLPEPGNPTSVNQLLQQLEETYTRQPGTISSQSLAVKITEQTDVKTETQAKPTADPGQVRQSPRLKKRKSTINIGFRTEKIMQNSMRIQTTKEPSPQKKSEKENRVPGGARSKTSTFECPNFDSEQDVIDCIQSTYEKTVSEGSCLMDFVQFTTSIVLSYMKSGSSESTENSPVTKARAVLTKSLLASSNQLRDKYQSLTGEPGQLRRVQEIELQVLLRLEMEAVSPTEVTPGKQKVSEDEDGVDEGEARREGEGESSENEGMGLPENVQVLVDEIVKLLRAVPFLADPNRLTTFLTETLLQNYADSLPHVLRAIYDDLMQPIPSILLSPSSDVAVSSVRTQPPPSYRPSSHGSFAEPSISSIRTRSLVRHPSLADMGSRRVIPVPSRNVANKKEKSKPKEDKNSSAKTVRRNLFMGRAKQSPRKGGSKLQRRQSVAVMQSFHNNGKSQRRQTPKKAKAALVLKTRVVKETPGKKQVLQAMLKKQERARRISSTSGETVVPPTPMRVVEESPLKPLQALNVRRSPRIKPRNPGDRRSFYSSSSSSDLIQARDLALRIAGKKTPTLPNQPLKLTSRKSLLSEICSPRSLPCLQKSVPVEDKLESPSRNTRSHVRLTPSKELPGEVDETEIIPDKRGKEEKMFKTPTRALRRINFKSPSKNSTTPIEGPTDGPIKDSDQLRNAAQVKEVTESPSKLVEEDGLKSPDRHTSRSTPRFARKSGGKTLAGPEGVETRSVSPTSEISVTSRTPNKQDAHTRTSPMRAKLVPTHGVIDPSEFSSTLRKSQPDAQEVDNKIAPSTRSKTLMKSPSASDHKDSDIHPIPLPVVTDIVETTRDKVEESLATQGNSVNLQIPRSRKRTLADRSPSPNTKATVNTPSPQKSTKSITPSSLQNWQRKKKPRRDSPEKSSSVGFQRATPPSAKRKRKIATPSPSESSRVTPLSEKRQRVTKERSSTKKQNQGIVSPEGSKRKTKQYKLGKVCKANVNLLTLMTDMDAPSASKVQTRSRSRESANSEGTSKDLQNLTAGQQCETYTFVDSHLDDSDDSNGVGMRAVSKSPDLSAKSSVSVFLSEDEASVSTDEVFLQESPSRSKKRLVTTPLTTGGLFELMNSPMVASGPKSESSRSKVSFSKPTRKGGRQLYPTGSQSSPESSSHNVPGRSSSLGLRRLSSSSPSGIS